MSSTRRRRAGVSILELIVSLSLMVVVVGPLYDVAGLSARAAQDARAAVAADERAGRLRATLARLVHDGRVVPALSLGPDGALHEEVVEGATRAWRASDALVVRRHDGYWVVERRGGHLLQRRLALTGQVVVTTLTTGVRATRFGLVGAGAVEYEVQFDDGRGDARGVVAPRVGGPTDGPPPAPRVAPRLGAGGGR